MPTITLSQAALTELAAAIAAAQPAQPAPPPAPPPVTPAAPPVAADPVAVFRSLTNQDARDAFLHGMDSRTHNRLLQLGLVTLGDINQATSNVVQNFGGAGGLDRNNGRPWVIYPGQTERTYF